MYYMPHLSFPTVKRKQEILLKFKSFEARAISGRYNKLERPINDKTNILQFILIVFNRFC